MMGHSISRILWTPLVAGALTCIGIVPAYAQSVAFNFDAPIDLGSNLDRVGDVGRWSYVLGTDWDANFQIGGIIGHKNATVIPEVPNPFPFGPDPLIHRVTADTRTGARMTGNVQGDAGLEFYADYEASGLETGTAFSFRPEIVNLPAQIPGGEFFQLQTVPGVVDNGTFTEALVDLPSFEAGMDFFFNLELDSRIEYGLFPFIPYGSTSFSPAPIHVNQSLIQFEVDLDPDSNGGVGLPPSFVILEDTPFENRIGLLDNSEFVAEKQFSVEVGDKEQPGVKRRLDIGSAHLVNPFGTGESLLGPNERNLTITTESNASSVNYSFETPLLRLGLDLDGIAAFLATGQSFTRLEEEFKDSRDNTIASITADFIDIKYGPEIGYRETLSIEPDFEVTLSFDQNVGLRNADSITIGNTFSGQWSDLPEIALLGEESVEVSVSFDQVTGEQTKRSVFYLSDYLELTLLELEELEILDTFSLSLPPVLRERTSLLGNLLGQVELALTDTTEAIAPFDVGAGLIGTSSFTLTPMPSTKVYLANGTDSFSTAANSWRELATHAAPASLENAVLVIATGESSAQVESDLAPTHLVDEGAGGFVQIDVAGLAIPRGSTFEQRGSRRWSLSRIANDGLYQFNGNSIDLAAPVILTIGGEGEMRFEGTSMAINAPLLSHNSGHTLTLRGAGGSIFVDQFDNAGQITIDNTVITQIVAEQRFSNSGSIAITRGGDNRLTTPELVNNGSIEVGGAHTAFTLHHPETFGQITLQSSSGRGQFVAKDGATLRFADTVLLNTPDVDEPSAIQFNATGGGRIQFDNPIRAFDAGVAELNVDDDSTLVLSGVEVMRPDAQVSLVNRGVVEVQAGGNRLYFNPPVVFDPNNPNPPEPEIVGINIINEGTIRIQPREGFAGPLFGFEAEIRNYVPGGATFSGGTWEVIGDIPAQPYKNDENPPFVLGQRTSELEILIKKVSNDDTFLGTIDFGDTDGDGANDGYSAEDYDTQLAVNEASVLLSGAARFDYFNTIRENRGQFTLRNKNHFDTDGDLLNSGLIRIEAGSRLGVHGNFTIDEGTVVVDATSELDVQGNTIEIIGGSLMDDRGTDAVFINSPWIVREKWVGVDDDGNDVVLEGRVGFGAARVHAIGAGGDVTLDGERAVFEPLAGLREIVLEGRLSLTGGSTLELSQSLTHAGTLSLDAASKLTVDDELLNKGHLEVGEQGYLEVTGELITRREPGGVSQPSVRLDGIIKTPNLAIWEDAYLRGTGRLVGDLTNTGTLTLAVARSASDEDERLQVDGEAFIGGNLQLELAGDTLPAAGDAIVVLSAAGGLASGFDNVASGERLETLDGYGSFVVQYGVGSPNGANEIVATAFEPDPLLGDYNGSGAIEQGDLDLVLLHWGEPALPAPAGWTRFLPKGNIDQAELDRVLLRWGTSAASVGAQAAVPEPASGILAVVVLIVAAASNRRRHAH
jgi:hypothetical protein